MHLEEDVLEQVVPILGFDTVTTQKSVNKCAIGNHQLSKSMLIAPTVPRQPVTLIEVDHPCLGTIDFGL